MDTDGHRCFSYLSVFLFFVSVDLDEEDRLALGRVDRLMPY